MTKKTKRMLAELYAIDASLRQHEKDLIAILEELQKTKPDTKFDRTFAEELREGIYTKIGERESRPPPEQTGKINLFSFSFSYMQALGIATASVMLGVTALNFPFSGDGYIRERKPDPTPQQIVMSSDIELIPVGSNAFGQITIEATAQASGKGGGGGGVESAASTADMKIMPPYEMTRYEYVYDGELDLPQTDMLPVYKRISNGDAGSRLADLISGYDLGLFNAGKLRNLGVQNISLAEDRDMGYMIMIDFINESVNIGTNYLTWDNPMNRCWEGDKSPEEAEKCVQRYALSPEDIPAENELIARADAFLNEYGIATSGYAAPYVNQEWRLYYEQAVKEQELARSESGDDAMIMPAPWVPDQIQITYPYLFGDEMVYDASGNPVGLSVMVDVRNNKVAGVYNLTTRTYEQSDYEVETDADEVLELVKKGGIWPNWYGEEAEEVKQVPLGEPTRGLVQHWIYENNTSSEIYVPALFFPVEAEATEGGFYPRTIVVPLVKDAIRYPDFYPILYREEPLMEDEEVSEPEVLPVEPDNSIGN